MNALGELEKFLYNKSPIPILIKIGLIHSQFEIIHPFLDGNGRAGRLLITFYLWHQKVLKNPILYLSVYFKKNQKDYYYWLQQIHEKDNIEGWLKFFLKGVITTAEESLATAQKVLELKRKDNQKILELGRISKNAMIVLNNLYKNPFVSLRNITSFTGLSKSNAYHLLKKLEGSNILYCIPDKSRKQKTFVYKDYLDLFE